MIFLDLNADKFKSMKKGLLILLSTLFISTIAIAQIDFGKLEEEQIYQPDRKYNTWSVTVGYGPVVYYSDVIDYTVFPSSDLKLGPALRVAKQLGRSWAIEGEFIMADMYGKKYQRYFEGDLMQGSLNLKAYINQIIFNGPIRDRWNIYAKAGLGVNFFRSTMRKQVDGSLLTRGDIFTGVSGYPSNYSDWRPDDYLVMGYRRNGYAAGEKTDRERVMVVPLGIGVNYRLNKSFDLGVEATLHNMTKDNLDVDMTGADNDSYMHASFSITYKIGKKNKRHASWTYKDFNLSYERDRRMQDNLAQKLDSLQQVLKDLSVVQGDTSVMGDTTYISRKEIIREETLSASVFFDFDKSEITERSHRTLAAVARFMKENPDINITIQGYTDQRGSAEYNMQLSQKRCNNVLMVLVEDYGIDKSRFTVVPKGDTELLSDTRSLAPRGIHLVNRRVDIFQTPNPQQ